PEVPPVQPMIWLGWPRSLLRRSQRRAHPLFARPRPPFSPAPNNASALRELRPPPGPLGDAAAPEPGRRKVARFEAAAASAQVSPRSRGGAACGDAAAEEAGLAGAATAAGGGPILNRLRQHLEAVVVDGAAALAARAVAEADRRQPAADAVFDRVIVDHRAG